MQGGLGSITSAGGGVGVGVSRVALGGSIDGGNDGGDESNGDDAVETTELMSNNLTAVTSMKQSKNEEIPFSR